MHNTTTLRTPVSDNWLKRLLLHERLEVRFLALCGVGAALFVITWTASYALLPEAFLRGRSTAAQLAGGADGNLVTEWLRLVAINLIPMLLIVLANRVLRINGYPLGYLIPLIFLVQYAILLGTNSFSIPLPARMAPSLAVFGRSGLYEIASYTLVAVATFTLPRYEIRRLFVTTAQPVLPPPLLALPPAQWLGIGLALGLLVAANGWEAAMIVAV